MKLALVIPTRGVIFARTIESTILSPILPPDTHVIIVSGRKIPDSHNECIRRALATDCTHIWFVEEDMEVPQRGLEIMMAYAKENWPVVAVDYKITPTVWTIPMQQREPIFCGFGCTMIDRKVFENYDLHDPWLTDKYEYLVEEENGVKKYIPREKPESKNSYGMFDIQFGFDMHRLGLKMHKVEGVVCNHLRLRSWERKVTNDGAHEIYAL